MYGYTGKWGRKRGEERGQRRKETTQKPFFVPPSPRLGWCGVEYVRTWPRKKLGGAPMASSPSLCVVVVVLLLTLACVALGQDGGGAAAMTCVKKLLPCQAFLQKPDQTPTPMCCVPLTEALQTETQCLCSIFNDEAVLKSFNVTKDAAMQLLKACKATVDLNVCNSTTNGTSSAAPAGAPPKTDPSASKGSTSPPKSSAVSNKSMWGSGTVLAAAWVALLTLAFY